VVAPHQELSGQLSKVVWIKSPVPLDIPGQRKSSPFWVEGAVPGMMVVTALMIVDLDGPNETLPPQLSRLVWVVGEPKRAALTRPVLVRRERRNFMVEIELIAKPVREFKSSTADPHILWVDY
jgi:hypothetical protein